MAQLYFDCSGKSGLLLDQRGAEVEDLIEARDYGARVVQSLVNAATPEDWRHWILHVRDDLGGELFEMPFSSVLGKPH